MKVKIIRSFKKYIPGEIYSFPSDIARRLVSRGDGEIVVENEIRKPDELEIRPKKVKRGKK